MLDARTDARYLAAALGWLRARLAAAIDPEHDPAALADAEASLAAITTAGPLPSALRLGERLGLSPFELAVILLCYAAELDPGLADQCEALQGQGRGYPTLALALAALPDASWQALVPEAPLRRLRLVEVVAHGALPRLQCPLRLDPRIADELRGLSGLDERLLPYLAAVDDPVHDLPPSQQATTARALALLAATSPPALALVGADPLSVRQLAAHLARASERRLLRFPLELAPTAAADLDVLVRLWTREAALAPHLLLLDARAAANPEPALAYLLPRLPAPVLIDSRGLVPAVPGATVVTVDVHKPAVAEQRAAWRALADLDEPGAARLGGHFDLGLPTIARAAALARSEHPAPTVDDLWRACLALTRPHLDHLATRIEPSAGWDDLVLPADNEHLLRQIADQVRFRPIVHDTWGFRGRLTRGLGVTALFAGESGTGKTLAAEVLARELALDLYRIDLSQVVSKYIGETEKNLRRLFDAAEDGCAVLFFDEADALFGKRSEVKDSHDRYANIETSYLLQRLETYRGLAILATNLKDSLDAAFLRRLRFVVRFPFPGPHERARIWQRVFPRQCDTTGLDFKALSELGLTGGHISTVAINAAFLAARAGGPLTMSAVLMAARAELRKLDRPDYGGPA